LPDCSESSQERVELRDEPEEMDWEGVFDCINFEDVISLHQLDEDELIKGEFDSPSSLFCGVCHPLTQVVRFLHLFQTIIDIE
jgi:hypothetical protein